MNRNPAKPGAPSRQPAVALCIGLTLLALALPVQATATVQADGPMLVHVALRSATDLGRVEAAGVPVYDRLAAQGSSYLIAAATPVQVRALRTQGLAVSVLDPAMQGPPVYLATWRTPRQMADLTEQAEILDSDGSQAVVRLTPVQVDELAQEGVELAQLSLDPVQLHPRRRAALSPTVDPDPLVVELIAQVDQATLYQYEGRLTGEEPALVGGEPYTITTRYTYGGAPSQKATEFTYRHLASLGLEVQYHLWSSSSPPNVVATQPGSTRPDNILILSAHLDDMPAGPRAPGADDNASGSAALLLAADILSQYSSECTLQYALWTGEEQGLQGSRAWAEWASSQDLNILGVLNLDMIAYDSDAAPIVDLHARSWLPDSVALANLFTSVTTAYDLDLQPDLLIDDRLGNYSDNKPFWDKGYAAILAIEDGNDFTPYYHTVHDQRATLNMDYFAEFVRASLATFAHMGGCLVPDQTGALQGHVTGAGLPLGAATVTMYNAAGGLFSTSTDSSGYYTHTLPAESYTVTAESQGYQLASVAGVVVSPTIAATVDFDLTPAPPCVPVHGASLSWMPEAPSAGETVAFAGTAGGTEPITFTWAFGDGQSGTGRQANHAYARAGRYPVVLTAANCQGSPATAARQITVNRPIYLPLVPRAGSGLP